VTDYPQPKQAATVILVRPEKKEGFEVFLTLRPAGMNFLGGMYVFPGGSVRKEDCCEAVLKRCRGLSRQEAKKILRADLSPELSLGHWVAGIRELFEEVGVLLCVSENGAPLDMKDERLRGKFAEKRQQVIAGAIDFPALLESEHLLCDAACMGYFSHWQTPAEFATRFDAWFYLAPLPPDQSPMPTSEEVTHSLWVTPERAMKLCEQGALPMIFPTYSVLRTLADFDSLESLFAEYRGNQTG